MLPIYPLDYRQINPIIRIAHRLGGAIRIPHRQIFDHELVLITRGHTEFFDDQTSTLCRAGDMLHIPPFLWHGFRPTGTGACEHVAVHFDFVPGIAAPSAPDSPPAPYELRLSDGLQLPRLLKRDAPEAPSIATATTALVLAWQNPRPPAALEARAHLLQILVALLSHKADPASTAHGSGELRNRRRIERAVHFINHQLARPISAEDIAAAAGLSPSQTARLFRQYTGHPPMQYLRRARIDRARHLLADVDLSIKQIAAQCGFDDPYHFSRVFHEIDGLPPTLHREALLAGRADKRP